MSKSTAGRAGGGVGRGVREDVSSFAAATSAREALVIGDGSNPEGWEETLSLRERNAISSYTMDGYAEINHRLRSEPYAANHLGTWPGTYDPIPGEIAALDQALERGTLKTNLIVHRGMNLASLKGYDNPESGKDPRSLVGKRFTDYGFTSTTLLPNKTQPGNIALVIKVPKGTHGKYIAQVSRRGDEHEVLLARGYDFRITKYLGRQGYGRPQFEAEIVGRSWHGDESAFLNG